MATIINSWADAWISIASPLASHLWQSTEFAVEIVLLTLLLRNSRARTRYWLWLTASTKFLIPFSLLTSVGEHFARHHSVTPANGVLYSTIDEVGHFLASPAVIPQQILSGTSSTSLPLVPILLASI